MTRYLTIVVAVAALAMVGAGCGGDDDASGDTDTIVASDMTDGDETTTDDTETVTDDRDAVVSCAEAVAAYQKLLGQTLTAAGPTGDAEDSVESFQEFADDAPEEIRDDVQVIADALADYLDTAADLDLDTGETPSGEQRRELREASEALAAPEVLTASENFFNWADENC